MPWRAPPCPAPCERVSPETTARAASVRSPSHRLRATRAPYRADARPPGCPDGARHPARTASTSRRKSSRSPGSRDVTSVYPSSSRTTDRSTQAPPALSTSVSSDA
ncbi:Uncharacterised protein [Mycobacteroides abscessus]|nr:Uncharacterised protein [Mycobacteroides abscessus]